MYYYCLGIRVNDVFQERTCEHRERCPYYTNVRLSIALSRPTEYSELDTYNNKPCNLYQQWSSNDNKASHDSSETSSMNLWQLEKS